MRTMANTIMSAVGPFNGSMIVLRILATPSLLHVTNISMTVLVGTAFNLPVVCSCQHCSINADASIFMHVPVNVPVDMSVNALGP